MKKSLILLVVLLILKFQSFCQQNIAEARAMGYGATVTIRGIVTNGPELGLSRYLQDVTAGLVAYSSSIISVDRGDSIQISGVLTNYNNLMEIDPVTSFIVFTGGKPLSDPQVITPGQMSEPYESELVRMNNVIFINGGGVFSGNTNYNITANGDTAQVRINNNSNLVGQIIPTGEVTLIGICSQFSYTNPNAGYQLLLRDMADIPDGYPSNQPDCSDLFISEYVEGSYNNKALEIYNPTNNTITFTDFYRLVRWANGSSSSDQDPLYVIPLVGAIGPNGVIVMIQDTNAPGQDTMIWPALRKKATYLAPYDYGGTTPGGNFAFWNGDDAISLQKKLNNGYWKDIDIFGEIGVRPTNWQGTYSPSGAWTNTKPYITGVGIYLTKGKTLVRKHTVQYGVDRNTMMHYGDSTTMGIPNSFYALLEYDSLPANFFDSLGFHRCSCYNNITAIMQPDDTPTLNLYPNPSNEKITIEFSEFPHATIVHLQLIQSDGQVMISQFIDGISTQIDISSFPTGVYIAKICMPKSIIIKKFIKQ